MKTKTIEHSKGEWDVIPVKTEEGFKKKTLEHYFQVVTKEQEHDNHIAQANANLIAAAPNLLEVLTHVDILIGEPEDNIEYQSLIGRRILEMWPRIQSAIQKATK